MSNWARVAVVGLMLSALTALWMSAETFDLIEVVPADPGFAERGERNAAPMPLAQMPALRRDPRRRLRELSFPDPTWPTDPVTIETARGAGLISIQGTGELDGLDRCPTGAARL